MNRIISILKLEPSRLLILKRVAELGLPDCYIAAGFVRNMVWDYLHDFPFSKSNDIDVLYYDLHDQHAKKAIIAQEKLSQQLSQYNWEVKNQAFMHLRNGDEQYSSSENAMEYWPEKETAVGIRFVSHQQFEVIAPFGVESLFNLKITHNPNRKPEIFKQRLATKNWKKQWPKLEVVF